MNKEEKKKALYKEKPIAIRTSYIGDYFHYVTQLNNHNILEFHVDKLEGKDFDNEMPAQLLIRWLQ